MDLLYFAHTYCPPKRRYCYKHRILNGTMSQSLQLNEELLMMQYGCYLSIHSLYGTCMVVADLATIKHSKIC